MKHVIGGIDVCLDEETTASSRNYEVFFLFLLYNLDRALHHAFLSAIINVRLGECIWRSEGNTSIPLLQLDCGEGLVLKLSKKPSLDLRSQDIVIASKKK